MTTRFEAFKWYSKYVLTMPTLVFMFLTCSVVGVWATTNLDISLTVMLLLCLAVSIWILLFGVCLSYEYCFRQGVIVFRKMVYRDLDPTYAINGSWNHCLYEFIVPIAWYVLLSTCASMLVGILTPILLEVTLDPGSTKHLLGLCLLVGLLFGVSWPTISLIFIWVNWHGSFSRLVEVMGCCGRNLLQNPVTTLRIANKAKYDWYDVLNEIKSSKHWIQI